MQFMHKVDSGMVPTYIADINPPLVMEISGESVSNNNIFLHHSFEQLFHQDHAYHQLPECRTILM